MLVYAAVRDPQAIAALWERSPGELIAMSIGGTLDPARSPPLPVRGTLVSKHDRTGVGRTIVLAVDHVRAHARRDRLRCRVRARSPNANSRLSLDSSGRVVLSAAQNRPDHAVVSIGPH